MNIEDRIARLKTFKANLVEWRKSRDPKLREWLNHHVEAVQRDVVEAGCLVRLTITPPPAVGGLVMQHDVRTSLPNEPNPTNLRYAR